MKVIKSKRSILKGLTLSSGVVVLSSQWKKPIVNSVVSPTHAMTSTVSSTPTRPTEPPEPPESGINSVSSVPECGTALPDDFYRLEVDDTAGQTSPYPVIITGPVADPGVPVAGDTYARIRVQQAPTFHRLYIETEAGVVVTDGQECANDPDAMGSNSATVTSLTQTSRTLEWDFSITSSGNPDPTAEVIWDNFSAT